MDKNKLNFITEIASTHNGNIRVLEKLINVHFLSNADFIKFQIFKSLNLYKKNTKKFKRFKKIEIDYEKWNNLIKKYFKKTNIILEPFDEESYNFCVNYSKKVNIKISSSESDNLKLISDANKKFKLIFINLSGYDKRKINYYLSSYKLNKKKNILMYGFQSYPTDICNLNFNNFDIFTKNGFKSGYADHTLYNSFYETFSGSILAILRGAKFIEKHVCHERKNKPPDYITSLELNEYKMFINSIKTFYTLIIKKNFDYSWDEKVYSNTMHKFAFAKKNFDLNEKIFESDLDFYRTKNLDGLTRMDIKKNKYWTNKKISKNEFINKKKIKNK